ncbi:MAG: GIY-YIG nuclease family protein [Bacteroidetes bacterium]|nr:GIY-YIG nuclease family protein [Bacteroidota bacterium]
MDFENSFYYVYVLFSETDDKHYVGYTHNLHLRFEQHNKGLVPSTTNRRPLKLIYFEASLNQQDSTRREKYFKTHYGRMFIKKRLQNYYANQCSNLIPCG